MHRPQLSAFLISLALAPAYGASTLQCEKIRVDDHSFDLSSLGGPHSVVTSQYNPNPPEYFNTTYTLDICKPLKKSGKSKKGDECPNGTRVCGIEHLIKGDDNIISDVRAIAGNLELVGGSQFDWEATRLKTSDSNSDTQKEGLRLVLKGGKHPLSGPVKDRKAEKAVIEFICDKEKNGDEGEWASEEEYEKAKPRAKRDEEKKEGDKDEDKDKDGGDEGGDDGDDGDKDGDDGESLAEHQLMKENAALIWESYKEEKDGKVLRLTWYTKHACESREDSGDDDGNGSTHWGFFTWFVIIVFLGIAAYLIFGSWLNYNRYGARGWDLLPHGDTIRDIPYLMKDWTRRVLNTVQGTGSRGGYSAV